MNKRDFKNTKIMKQTFLTLAFIFSLSVCFSQTNKNLFLDMRLSTDTIYASNDIFTISAQIKNIGFFPKNYIQMDVYLKM